jgi:acetyl-CoA carboxylase carboxyltransferase component
MIAVMGPEAAVNAVFYNKIQEVPEPERKAYVEMLREEYRQDIDLYKLAANLHVDAIVRGADLRAELILRFRYAAAKQTRSYFKRRSVTPV